MTPFTAAVVALATVGAFIAWRITIALSRLDDIQHGEVAAPRGPETTVLICDREACAGLTWHVLTPCGAALCLDCGHETPVPAA
ncbi:hypothetical protein [Streptomyces chumphonensis]|uniref:hypothetical protein n=1 Tax=Streptomyces chumphonensis TaxID=1214925 RepID=UPI003D750B08